MHRSAVTVPFRGRRAALCRAFLLAAGLVLLAPPGEQLQASALSQPELEAAIRAVYPALVNISVVAERFADGRTYRYPAAGSGVIVTPTGHVLTNYHVAGNTSRISCTLTSGEVLDARVVVHDPLTDLSVLQLELSDRAAGADPLPWAAFGDSDRLRVGDAVLAMGNPLALSSSTTQGVVSNPARVFTDFTGSEIQELELGAGEQSGLFTRWIQHDALILPGNSGGPLVSSKGEVVGINELGGSGLGFAIPSSIASRVLDLALQDGRIVRGWLGLTVLPVRKLGLETGALVSGVLPESPASTAGVRPGDLLVEVAGEPVTVRFFEQVPLLYQRIADLPVGATVELTVDRDGRRLRLMSAVAEMEPIQGAEDEIPELGITAQEITGPMALARALPSRDGLLLTGVRPGRLFDGAKPRLAVGDVLLELGEEPVVDLASLRRAGEGATGTAAALVRFRRGEEDLLAVLPPRRDSERPWGGELPRAWLGIKTQVLTPELAESLGIPEPGGHRVTQLYRWTEASRAGLRTGDLIVALNGQPMKASRLQDGEDLARAVEELGVGQAAELSVLRGGQRLLLEVALEERPADAADAPRWRQDELEFTVRDIGFLDRTEKRWDRDQKGVLVVEVTQGGWAHMAGMRLEDLILEVSGEPVGDVAAFRLVMERVAAVRPQLISLFVRRGSQTHFLFVEPTWEEG